MADDITTYQPPRLVPGDQKWDYMTRITLLNWRPFKGAFLPSKSTTKSLLKPPAHAALEKNLRFGRALDTSGLDVFITLVRGMAAFGWAFLEFDSEEEKTFIDVALSELGSKEHEDRDRAVKGNILKLLYPDCSLEEYQENPKTFQVLMDRLPRLFLRNGQFKICRGYIGFEGDRPTYSQGFSKEKVMYEIEWTVDKSVDDWSPKLQDFLNDKVFGTKIGPEGSKYELLADEADWIRIRRDGAFPFTNA